MVCFLSWIIYTFLGNDISTQHDKIMIVSTPTTFDKGQSSWIHKIHKNCWRQLNIAFLPFRWPSSPLPQQPSVGSPISEYTNITNKMATISTTPTTPSLCNNVFPCSKDYDIYNHNEKKYFNVGFLCALSAIILIIFELMTLTVNHRLQFHLKTRPIHGDLISCYCSLTDWLKTLKDRAIQLLGSSSGAFLTQILIQNRITDFRTET